MTEMTAADLIALAPLIVLAGSAVVVMLAIAVRRSHSLAAGLTAAGLGATLAVLPWASSAAPRQVTPLLAVDGYALFYTALLAAAALVVTALYYGYFKRRRVQRKELYLLLLATQGSVVLVGSTHFASLFLGLELLSVALYALIAYPRSRKRPLEAGLKYLVLAAASSTFLLFGMALIYAATGSMEIQPVMLLLTVSGDGLLVLAGLGLMVTGIGFKLALVPFHMWTPDVYAGAPPPVPAFVASVSKGGMFALVLRFFAGADGSDGALFLVLGLIAVASMLVGNLMALLQDDVRRLLAYSSIAHLGYLLVAMLAGCALAREAATFYLVAYFVTILGAFGVVSALSGESDAEPIADFRGLFWQRPGIAVAFTASLLSLAGIPLTAGFLGKFYVLAAGVGAALWALAIALVVNSAIGLFYYLRVVVAMFSQSEGSAPAAPWPARLALTVLAVLVIWLGVHPEPLVRMIQTATAGL